MAKASAFAQRADYPSPRIKQAAAFGLRHSRLFAQDFQSLTFIGTARYRINDQFGKIRFPPCSDTAVRLKCIHGAEGTFPILMQEERKIVLGEQVHCSADCPAFHQALRIHISAPNVQTVKGVIQKLRLNAAQVLHGSLRIRRGEKMLSVKPPQSDFIESHMFLRYTSNYDA